MSDLIRREDVLKLAKEGVLISNDMNRYAREIINSIPIVGPTIDEITERIYLTDWYHINSYGDLVQGASGREDALYKAEDIFNILKDMGAEQENEEEEWDWDD